MILNIRDDRQMRSLTAIPSPFLGNIPTLQPATASAWQIPNNI